MKTVVSSSIYRHHKGGRYLLLLVAETHEHNGDLDAVYVCLSTGKAVTRPFEQDSRKQDSWQDVVPWPDGNDRARFVKETVGYDGGEYFDNLFGGTCGTAQSEIPSTYGYSSIRNSPTQKK
jgi:hypothetical protein